MMGFVERQRLAVVLSALVLAGCQSSLSVPDPAWMPSQPQVVKLDLRKKTGSVTLRLKGLKDGFTTKTLDSPLDLVDHLDVRLTHNDSESTWDATLSGEQLSQETIETTFEDIPAGSVTLTVIAYDVENQTLGEGSGEGTVNAGENISIPVHVLVNFPSVNEILPE